jgi:WD40 repeat protein
LAVRGLNQRIRLWDTNTGKELRQINQPELSRRLNGYFLLVINDAVGPEMRALAFSPDSKRIASAAGATVRLWEAATGKEIHLLESHWRAPSAIVLSPDGKTLLTWGDDRIVRRWQTATGKQLGVLPAPQGTTLAAFSSNGKIVAFANEDNFIRLHDTATGKELGRLKGPGTSTEALAFDPAGKVLAARGTGLATIQLYDLARKQEIRQLVIGAKSVEPDGRVIVFLNLLGTQIGSGPGVVFSPDGKLLAAPFRADGGRSKSIVLLDAATGKELRRIDSPQPIASFTFSPDSRTLATEHGNGTIILWEVASGKQRGQLGENLAGKPANKEGRTELNVVVDLDESIATPAGGPTGVSFSPDGRAVATIAPDRSIRVFDVVARKQIGMLHGHKGALQTVVFAPNGTSLATGSNDTTVLLWDAIAALKNLAQPAPLVLTAEQISSLWGDLAGPDAVRASQSVHQLVAGAKDALPFLFRHLKPAPWVELRKINGWIADLENEKFSVRQQAMSQLLKVGQQAVAPVQKLLASGPPLEMRRRAEELLERLTSGTLTPEQLRVVRAVEVLERIATPEARRLLKALAEGGPGELSTREAQAARDRLATSKP